MGLYLKSGMAGVLVLMIILFGCVSKPSQMTKNETPVTPPSINVPPAPKELYIKVGQSEQFTYWGHNIEINYISAYPKQTVKVTVNGKEKNIEVEITAPPRGIYWKEGNLSFVLKPVVWEVRNGQRVPIYEKTWNTTELYFEVVTSGIETNQNKLINKPQVMR